jgi:hypothetical protein
MGTRTPWPSTYTFCEAVAGLLVDAWQAPVVSVFTCGPPYAGIVRIRF